MKRSQQRKVQSLTASAISVTAMMLLFKILGFVKQAVVAYFYGADKSMDTYMVAYGFVSAITDSIFRSLGVSIVAVYSSIRINRGQDASEEWIAQLIELMIPVCLIVTSGICIFTPAISKILAPEYTASDLELLMLYIRLLAPTTFFVMFEFLWKAVLDSNNQFYVGRLQSLIYSVCIIAASFFASKTFGTKALVAGQYVSSILFFLLMLTAVHKVCPFHFKKIKFTQEIQTVLFTAAPLFIGNSALQLNNIVDKSIATGLSEGTASALAYCHVLEQFVTSIMIVNVGDLLFARFARSVAEQDERVIKKGLHSTINILITVLLAVSVLTVICARDIVEIVYFRGAFTQEAVVLTASALVGYALSFPLVAVRDLVIKGNYAFGDTRYPMIASISAIACNISLSLILSQYIGILGISLATSISVILGMAVNIIAFHKHVPSYRFSAHVKLTCQLIPAVICLYLVVRALKNILYFSTFINFMILVAVGFAVYIGVAWICNVKTVKELAHMILGKLIHRRHVGF